MIHDQVAESDKVVSHKSLRGTHQGEFICIPPAGKGVSLGVTGSLRLADGKIVAHRAVIDSPGLLQQLSVVPAPP